MASVSSVTASVDLSPASSRQRYVLSDAAALFFTALSAPYKAIVPPNAWSRFLPEVMMTMITDYLYHIEHIRAILVCRSWRISMTKSGFHLLHSCTPIPPTLSYDGISIAAAGGRLTLSSSPSSWTNRRYTIPDAGAGGTFTFTGGMITTLGGTTTFSSTPTFSGATQQIHLSPGAGGITLSGPQGVTNLATVTPPSKVKSSKQPAKQKPKIHHAKSGIDFQVADVPEHVWKAARSLTLHPEYICMFLLRGALPSSQTNESTKSMRRREKHDASLRAALKERSGSYWSFVTPTMQGTCTVFCHHAPHGAMECPCTSLVQVFTRHHLTAPLALHQHVGSVSILPYCSPLMRVYHWSGSSTAFSSFLSLYDHSHKDSVSTRDPSVHAFDNVQHMIVPYDYFMTVPYTRLFGDHCPNLKHVTFAMHAGKSISYGNVRELCHLIHIKPKFEAGLLVMDECSKCNPTKVAQPEKYIVYDYDWLHTHIVLKSATSRIKSKWTLRCNSCESIATTSIVAAKPNESLCRVCPPHSTLPYHPATVTACFQPIALKWLMNPLSSLTPLSMTIDKSLSNVCVVMTHHDMMNLYKKWSCSTVHIVTLAASAHQTVCEPIWCIQLNNIHLPTLPKFLNNEVAVAIALERLKRTPWTKECHLSEFLHLLVQSLALGSGNPIGASFCVRESTTTVSNPLSCCSLFIFGDSSHMDLLTSLFAHYYHGHLNH